MHENRRIEWKIEIAEKKTKTIEKDREEKRELEWRKKTKYIFLRVIARIEGKRAVGTTVRVLSWGSF